MANEEALISGIEHKVRKLVDVTVGLKEENTKLHQHIITLEKELKVLTKEIELKRSELLNITLANTLEVEYGVEESKEKIGSLINEIDKCIAVLSD